MRVVLLIAVAAGVLAGQQSTNELELQKSVVEKNPRDAEAQARLGIAYQNAGLLPEAAQALEKSLQLNPALPRVAILLAFVYMSGGRYPEAVPLLRSSFAGERELDMQVLVGQRLVECLFTTGGEDEALEVVQKLRKLKPDDPDILYLSSKAHANLWNVMVQRLLAKSADSYRAHQILAEVLETQEKFSEAAAEYRTIIRLQPRLAGFHYRLRQDAAPCRPVSGGREGSFGGVSRGAGDQSV